MDIPAVIALCIGFLGLGFMIGAYITRDVLEKIFLARVATLSKTIADLSNDLAVSRSKEAQVSDDNTLSTLLKPQ